MPRKTNRERYPVLLFAAFVAVFVALGVQPRYPADWLLENILVLVAVPLLAWGYAKEPFSNVAYTSLFFFLVLHEIGAHYTYSEVPYEQWTVDLAGGSLNDIFGWERNHYDRFVHFAYGLLLFRLAWELVDRLLARPGAWTWILSFCLILSASALYELIEAGAAALFGRDLGMAYLGTQGDVWDAQKDMAAACGGALIASSVSTLVRVVRFRRTPSAERRPLVIAAFFPAPTCARADSARREKERDTGGNHAVRPVGTHFAR